MRSKQREAIGIQTIASGDIICFSTVTSCLLEVLGIQTIFFGNIIWV